MRRLLPLFRFAGTDRRVLPVILVVLLVAVAWLAYRAGVNTTYATATQGHARTEKGTEREKEEREAETAMDAAGGYAAAEERKVERFAFDPNTADSTTLLRLGLSRWQVRGIYRYRAKGGVYHRPTDFARLYGLTVRQYRELEPYIRIGADYRLAAEVYGTRPYAGTADARMADAKAGGAGPGVPSSVRDTLKYPVKLKAGQRIALNTSDTTLLKKVPGIGSYYARRVVMYRQRLGGFHDVSQLLEIEGFPASALPYFSLEAGGITKLNVNKLTLAQLRQHPYLSYYQARDIIDYRRLRGPITHLSQLRLLKDFSEDDLRRLEPYVEY